MESNAILSRVALRVGDEQFKDFDRSIYEDALKKANREIARKYQIQNKVISFKTSDMIEDVEDTIILNLDDCKSVYAVYVNGKKLFSQDLVTGLNSYKLVLVEDRYHFDYRYFVDLTSQYTKSLEDEVTIYYVAMPEYDSPISDYFVPQKYIEEQIEETAKVICQYGLAKFTDEIKVAKYSRIFQLLQKNSDYNKFQTEDREWITFKMWSPI